MFVFCWPFVDVHSSLAGSTGWPVPLVNGWAAYGGEPWQDTSGGGRNCRAMYRLDFRHVQHVVNLVESIKRVESTDVAEKPS